MIRSRSPHRVGGTFALSFEMNHSLREEIQSEEPGVSWKLNSLPPTPLAIAIRTKSLDVLCKRALYLTVACLTNQRARCPADVTAQSQAPLLIG
jgi:hypothetical protein